MEIIESRETYKAPQAKVIEVNVQSVLCLSMYERDYGNGGFEEV